MIYNVSWRESYIVFQLAAKARHISYRMLVNLTILNYVEIMLCKSKMIIEKQYLYKIANVRTIGIYSL
jgi:hypothetical protein